MSTVLNDTIDTDESVVPNEANLSLPLGASSASTTGSATQTTSPDSHSQNKHHLLARRLHRSPHVMMWQHYLAREAAQDASVTDEPIAWDSDARLLHDLVRMGYAHRTWTPKIAGHVRSSTQSLLPLLRSLVESSVQTESRRGYAETLLLYSLMPLYINVDQTKIAVGAEQSYQLLREALVLLSLDTIVDLELVEVLSDESCYLTPPCDAVKSTFNYNLIEIAHFIGALKLDPMLPNAILTGISQPHRNGYWSLALQWLRGANHITIPPELAVGHVAWHLAKDHWSSFYAELRRSVMEKRGIPANSDAAKSDTNNGKALESKMESISSGIVSAINRLASQAISTELSAECMKDNNNCPSLNNCTIADNVSPRSNLMESISPPVAQLAPPPEIIELRTANDPQLASRLDAQLVRCRDTQGTLALAVIKPVRASERNGTTSSLHPGLVPWQSSIIDLLTEFTDRRLARGFITGAGELALIVEDIERNELTQMMRDAVDRLIREAATKVDMIERPVVALASGIACVTSPSKSFKIDQLVQAAWRCLSAAESQGSGAVKSIEVY